MKFTDVVQTCNRVDMVRDCVVGVVQNMLSCDPLEHCLVNSKSQKDTLPTSNFGDAYYHVEENFEDCVYALGGGFLQAFH